MGAKLRQFEYFLNTIPFSGFKTPPNGIFLQVNDKISNCHRFLHGFAHRLRHLFYCEPEQY